MLHREFGGLKNLLTDDFLKILWQFAVLPDSGFSLSLQVSNDQLTFAAFAP